MAELSILFSEIRGKIIDGELKEALLKLNAWSNDSESYLNDEIAQRLAHFNSNERSYNLGNISNTDYEIEKNKITKATLILLDEAKSSASTPYQPAYASTTSSSNASRTTPKSYSTINESISNNYQEKPNATLVFFKKNMLWVGLALIVVFVLIFIIRNHTAGVAQEPDSDSSQSYETKQ